MTVDRDLQADKTVPEGGPDSSVATASARPPLLEPRDGPCLLRGLVVLNALSYVEQRDGAERLARVIARLGPADRALLTGGRMRLGTHLGMRAWVPFSLHCRCLTAIAAELGDPEVTLFDLGRFSAQNDIPALFFAFAKLSNPGWIVDASTKLWRFYHHHGGWQVDRTRAELIARLHGHEQASAAFCTAFMGWLDGALRLSGAQDVEQAHPACKDRGAPECVFTVRWR